MRDPAGSDEGGAEACGTAWAIGVADVQTNGVFQLNVKNGEGKEAVWV